ncbi:MAG: transglycosylase SLT domain-containing protein [Gammaproteobacteria bacterium]|nr:transglycosylase SLT domain-containing protein [Gammaproteobacteria bacterium]MYC51177.1 transglycosylase SLT domain-containing protein [Gammaproteobacteria bacterium]
MTRGAHLVFIAGAAWASTGCFLGPSRAPVEMPAAPSEPGSPAEAEAAPAARDEAQALAERSPAPKPAMEPTTREPEVEAPAEPEPEPVPVDAVTGSPAAAHHELADDLDEWFDYWLDDYGPNLRLSLERMGRYGDMVDAALEERGMPRSLRYLPIAESYYNPRAYSRVGAAGMWQFMPGTARERGLLVNSLVDERRDPEVATEAALDMLAELRERFDSWFLALAAYNGGPNRVARLLRRHHSGPPGDSAFMGIRDRLPRETRHFIPKFLAVAAIADDPGAYGITDIELEPALEYDETTVPDPTSLDVVAQAAGVSEDDIRVLNPHLPARIVPTHIETVLRLPVGTVSRFERNYAAIPTEERLTIVEHTISAGETLGHIAETYGVRLSDLMDTNPGLRPRYLQIGQKVVVPRLRRVLAGEGSG